MAPAAISVLLAGGDRQRVAVSPAVAGVDHVLFVDRGELALLERLVDRLGGARKREWKVATDVPNQPIGASVQVIAFWSQFFPARAGHWGGWVLETYPIITAIDLSDPTRSRATADVIVVMRVRRWCGRGSGERRRELVVSGSRSESAIGAAGING